VTDISVVVVCLECREFWPLAGAAKCVDPHHEHQKRERHRHRTEVVLPDGTDLIAASFDEADPYARDPKPAYGLYLDGSWRPPWPHEHFDWPDFGVPEDPAGLMSALRRLLNRARAGDRVEIGCLGGHGRTGTALACLAVLSGHPPVDAVAWVRDNYCVRAVETEEQVVFVMTLAT
jgi:hypothetical protein